MENKNELDIVLSQEIDGKEQIWSISSIQFPNVVTQGKTIEEAKLRLKEALELYLEDMTEEREEAFSREAPMISRMFL